MNAYGSVICVYANVHVCVCVLKLKAIHPQDMPSHTNLEPWAL